MSQYYEWSTFHSIYLEDSFVIEIKESSDVISFVVEMVLTEEHPEYSCPKKDEQYYYKKGEIIFGEITGVRWLRRNTHPTFIGMENQDLGNIDFFELTQGSYHLAGEWGEVIINSASPELSWLE